MTNVYIDGFNVYHGCVAHTGYKWLDYIKLTNSLVRDIELNTVYYFTARIKGEHDQLLRQIMYIRALEQKNIKVVYGFFSRHKKRKKLVSPTGNENYARVWNTEEKGTDVNIACQMLYDAFFDKKCEQLLLMSNDSDLITPIQMIKKHTDKKIGVVFPVAHKGRKASQLLVENSHFQRKINFSHLRECQLPEKMNDGVEKPAEWYDKKSIDS